METKTTIKKLLGITYLTEVRKRYSENLVDTGYMKIVLVTTETYLFDIKIHSTQITF